MDLNERHLELIRKRVKELDSTKAFADEIGMSDDAVNKWLNGKSNRIERDETVERVANSVGMDLLDFFAIAANRPVRGDQCNPRGHSDRISRFADWLRRQDEEKQESFFIMMKSSTFYTE
jgi:transcriptional regulator with XRE-family HTH domain